MNISEVKNAAPCCAAERRRKAGESGFGLGMHSASCASWALSRAEKKFQVKSAESTVMNQCFEACESN